MLGRVDGWAFVWRWVMLQMELNNMKYSKAMIASTQSRHFNNESGVQKYTFHGKL